MNIEELHEASYRGAFFFVTTSEISGGRKDAKKVFVDSDLQVIEDLGLRQREFTVNGTIAARFSTDGAILTPYLQARDDLLAALEKGKTGILIHPWYGRLENIVCRTFSISEDIGRLGDAQITIVFEISNTDGVPVASESVITLVAIKHKTVTDTAKSVLQELWDATTGIFTDAVAKAEDFITAVNKATSPIAALASEINSHANLLTTFSATVTTLVSTPQKLSDSIFGVMDSVGGLFSSADGTLTAFSNLFDFGDDDVDASQATKIAIDRKRNDDAMNFSVQAMALSFSYFHASLKEYQTIADIEAEAAKLEVQYQKLFADVDIDQSLLDTLTDLRLTTQEFFDAKKLISSQIITVQTTAQSTRLTAFAYYGSSERGELLAELNGLYDLTYRQGDLEILTP